MIGLSDENMATNPQGYKDREDYSRRSSSLLCDAYTFSVECLTFVKITTKKKGSEI